MFDTTSSARGLGYRCPSAQIPPESGAMSKPKTMVVVKIETSTEVKGLPGTQEIVHFFGNHFA